MGVGILVLLLRQSREQQSTLLLSAVPHHMERILAVTGLLTAFHIEASVEEAVQVVQGSTKAGGRATATGRRAGPPPASSQPEHRCRETAHRLVRRYRRRP
ncbi:hypothetical protein E1295_07070 [Nonomuraea mesophila]|uniref:STAS domain-containing protein n=1 Tax=Nonomuraea mesophila TaxID=2530382 RepID=A0A4R5FUI0_9ACTN|nr:STAS domain-containing protein [Nonomuraea mesophila]TDE57721.1 hypothetical protein E1295_07070 [Nonomuraea mesophila]